MAYDTYTKLLLHADGEDAKANKAVTAVANAQIDTAQYKFGTGSLLSDGTGDYLSLATHADFDFSASNFTVEGWYRFNTVAVGQALFAGNSDYIGGVSYNQNVANKLSLDLSSNHSGWNICNNAAGTKTDFAANTWYHIAFTWDGTTYRVFVDGVLDISVTSSTGMYATAGMFIGTWGNGGLSFNGWIDEFRVSKGIARYTDTFTPSTTAFTTDTYTKLLLHCDGADASTAFGDESAISDNSNYNHPVTFVGTAQLDTAQKEFGASAILLDGNSDYLSIPDSADWDLFANSADKATIDCWIKFSADPAPESSKCIITQTLLPTNTRWILSYYDNAAYGVYFSIVTNASVALYIQTGAIISDANWHHVAVVKNGTAWYLFLDGTIVDSDTVDTTFNITAPIYIGWNGTGGTEYFDGHLDEIRISKGIARWTSNFTPHTSAYKPLATYSGGFAIGNPMIF